jgi:hypothetical protein
VGGSDSENVAKQNCTSFPSEEMSVSSKR